MRQAKQKGCSWPAAEPARASKVSSSPRHTLRLRNSHSRALLLETELVESEARQLFWPARSLPIQHIYSQSSLGKNPPNFQFYCRSSFATQGLRPSDMSAGNADFFCKEAQRLKYVARSAFKLLDIQKKHRLLRPGATVLDLGCAPGAWLQVACQTLGPPERGGTVVGVDLQKVKLPLEYCGHRVRTLCADVLSISPQVLANLAQPHQGYSVILSDMCPSVSGIRSRDAALSGKLGERVLDLALGSKFAASRPVMVEPSELVQEEWEGLLEVGGSIAIKLLEGEESQSFASLCKGHFRTAGWYRPRATRAASTEIYFIAKQFYS